MALPETMTALRLHGVGLDQLRYDTVETPRPGPGQLVARVEAAIACASDNKIIDQGGDHTLMYGWDLAQYPMPIAHEGCVTVAAVGESVPSEYAIGRRFAIQPAVPSAPRHHRERYRDKAAGVEKIAIGYTLPGLFAEYVLISEEVIDTGCLLPLPSAEMPSFAAALAEPLSCVVSAQEHTVHLLKDSPTRPRCAHLGLKPGGVVAVLGAGPMGRMHVEVAFRYQPRAVIVSDPMESRLARLRGPVEEKAKRLGVEMVLTGAEDFENTLSRVSGGRGADDIIVAVGIRSLQERAFELLAPGGVVNFFGGLKTGDHMLSLDARRIHYDSVIAVGSSGGDPSDVASALSLIQDGTIDAGNYVAAVGGLDAAEALIRAVRAQELDGKGVIYPRLRSPLRSVDGWSAEREAEFIEQQSRA